MTEAVPTVAPTNFTELGLSPSVLAAVQRVNYTVPTPIQASLIPPALTGRDVIGQAQTGTGKTCAFLLPFFSRWKESTIPGPFAMVLAPTRELVAQVAEESQKLSPSSLCRTVAIYGGKRIQSQLRELQQGCTVVVGTPGRMLDHLKRGSLSLARVQYVVLDEADRMLDIGFRPDIERILRRCPTERQTLLMSATLPSPVLRLAHRYMVQPMHINLSPAEVTVERIQQSYVTVDEDFKLDLLIHLAEQQKPRQAIIFCQRKRTADELYRDLRTILPRVGMMHGDLDQKLRERIMQAFRAGKLTYLVATDVVGRGIDVSNISHIFNYDLPEDPENYVHRIGRTGRMGTDGIAIAFVTPEQGLTLTNIEAFINKLIPELKLDGLVTRYPPKPSEGEPERRPSQHVFGRQRKRYSQRP